MNRQIILASISPRRRELMKLFKIKFKAVESGYDEVVDPRLPHSELVKFLALGKAKTAAKKYPNAIIIAADTMVSFKGKAIGKPKNQREAFLMLKKFSGTVHSTVSGVVVLDAKTKQIFTHCDGIKIYFKKLSDAEIKAYLLHNEALDKAGAYGPLGKGMNLIKKIEGDYTTAIGMPLNFVFNSLLKLGVKF